MEQILQILKDNAPEKIEFPDTIIKQLQKCSDLCTAEEINDALIKYTKCVSLLKLRFPEFNKRELIDWSIAYSLGGGEFYSSNLGNRIGLSLVVAALFITITAPNLLSVQGLGDYKSDLARATFYLNGLCTICFLVSIVIGTAYVNNILSRTYCWSDQFTVMCKHYGAFMNCIHFSFLGSVIFPLTLIVPLWELYIKADAYIMITFFSIYIFIIAYSYVIYTIDTNKKMASRIDLWEAITVDEGDLKGHLKTEFYPVNQADRMEPQDFAAMYASGETMKTFIKLHA